MTTTFQEWMFPLRVAPMGDGTWGIWTASDAAIGSRNNFALANGIQHEADAIAICDVLNDARVLLFEPVEKDVPWHTAMSGLLGDLPEAPAHEKALADECYRKWRA